MQLQVGPATEMRHRRKKKKIKRGGHSAKKSSVDNMKKHRLKYVFNCTSE